MTPGRRAVLVGTYGSIVNPGVKTLATSALASSRGPSGDPTEVVLHGHVAFGKGTIVSLPPSERLPRGLLAHVVRQRFTSTDTVLAVHAARVDEVAPVYRFDIPLTPAPKAAGLGGGLSAGCGSPSGVMPYRTINDITISGGWNTVRVLRHDLPIGVRAEVHFTANAGVNVTGGLGLACSLRASISANGMAGPIPVTAGIEGDLSASAELGAQLSTGGSLHVDAGVSTVGIPPLLVWVPNVAFSDPRFFFAAQRLLSAQADVGVGVKVGIGNDDVASATVKLGSSVALTIQPGSCRWDARFGQFSAEGSLLDWTIESPRTPAFYTRGLWHSACHESDGGSTGGGGPAPGGGPPGSGPAPPVHLGPASAIATGWDTGCAILATRNVACWGALSPGNGESIGEPLWPASEVSGLTGATSIAGGESSICATLTTGHVVCWGYNFNGELGDGTLNSSAHPVTAVGVSNAVQVTVGASHACAVLADGGVKCWGRNDRGQLGDGTLVERHTAVPVVGLSDAIQISAGGYQTCVLRATHTVACWGALGDGPSESTTPVDVPGITTAEKVSAGHYQTCVLLLDHSIRCWGYNGFGGVGDGTTESRSAPVAVLGMTNATDLSTGNDHSCAVADGQAWCWGEGHDGELGDGTMPSFSAVPVAVSSPFAATSVSVGTWSACGLTGTGAVACWGGNASAWLGQDVQPSARSVPNAIQGIP
jgi:alpha-tubulin suppressor-like RCC1 family protein